MPMKDVNVWYASGENAWLSNLALRPFTGYDLRKYFSVEHAYQTWKSGKFNEKIYQDPRWQKGGVKVRNPAKYKSEDWAIRVMFTAMCRSFEQNPDELGRLLKLGEVNFTHKQDRGFWGKRFPELLRAVQGDYSFWPTSK